MNRWAEYRAGTLTPPAVVQRDTLADGSVLLWIWDGETIVGPVTRASSVVDGAVAVEVKNAVRNRPATRDELKERIDELQARIDEKNARIDEKNARIDDLVARVAVKDARIDDLVARVAVKDARIDELVARVAEKNARIDQLLARIAELENP